jgi:hypothetical protein
MKIILVILLINYIINEKNWIYFNQKETLNYKNILISKESEQRRSSKGIVKFYFKKKNNIDHFDFPVNIRYIQNLELFLNKKIHTQSKWLNAVSINLTENEKKILLENKIQYNILKIEKVNTYHQIHKNSPTFSHYSINQESSHDQLNQLNALQLHKRNITGKGVVILICDSGFRYL